MKNQKEIDAEIKALEACKTYSPERTFFGDDNHRNIDLQIEYLRGEIDTTDDEDWNDFNCDEQSAILDAESWKKGQSKESPSSGWDAYKPKI
jgi:hypothetical protein